MPCGCNDDDSRAPNCNGVFGDCVSHDGHWLEKALAIMWGFGWCTSEWMVVHRLQVVGMDMESGGGPGVHEPLLAAEPSQGESPDLYA